MRAAAAKRTVTRTSEVTLPTDRKARRGWQKATAKRYTWAGVRGSVDLGMGTSVVKELGTSHYSVVSTKNSTTTEQAYRIEK